jgi:hypothetical protein
MDWMRVAVEAGRAWGFEGGLGEREARRLEGKSFALLGVRGYLPRWPNDEWVQDCVGSTWR